MQNRLELGRKIKNARLVRNLTMDVCAKESGITRATLWAIESGKGNYSIDALLKVLNVLHLSLNVSSVPTESERKRAARINSLINKKINEFIIYTIEEYAAFLNRDSGSVYKELKNKNIVDELKNDYEDLHGMSTEYLNNYIHSLCNRD